MNDYRQALRFAISSEAKAYGFTLVVWGTGALEIVGSHGNSSRAEIFAFIGGALLGMIAVVALAFPKPPFHLDAAGAVALRLRGHPRRLRPLRGPRGMGDATALSGVTAYFARSLVAIVIFQLLLAAEILLSVAGYKKGEAQMAGSPESR